MKICAVIAEFNPFHNGHKYLINKIKEDFGDVAVISLMSGNFVQRGEPAITDKWKRCEMALSEGVDLIFELPFVFACNNARDFARGSIGILNAFGCVDHLVFGTEYGDLEKLENIANKIFIETEEFKEELDKQLNKGISYSGAYINAVRNITGEDEKFFARSNNILALEYLKEMRRCKSSMKAYSVARKSAGYNDVNECEGMAGASQLRKLVDESFDWKSEISKYMPKQAYRQLVDSEIFTKEDFFRLIRYKLIGYENRKYEASKFYGIAEGLENRFIDAAARSGSIADILERVGTKRYSEARIKRVLISVLTDFEKQDYFDIKESKVFYTRVLGFTEKGQTVLSIIKKKNKDNIDIMTNPNKYEFKNKMAEKQFSYDVLAQTIYWSVKNRRICDVSDLVKSPIIKRKVLP